MRSWTLGLIGAVVLAGCGAEDDIDLTDERAESAAFEYTLNRNTPRQIMVPAPPDNPVVLDWTYQVSDENALLEGSANGVTYTWDPTNKFIVPGLPPGKETLGYSVCVEEGYPFVPLGTITLVEGPATVDLKIDAQIFSCPPWTLRTEIAADMSDNLVEQLAYCQAAYDRMMAANPVKAEALYNGTFCQ